MIASAQTLRKVRPVSPFVEKTIFKGLSYGLSSAGYDIRIAQSIVIPVSNKVTLASSLEQFHMPNNLLGVVHDKSTWARSGLFVQNTVIEPGWYGFLTLELTNQGFKSFLIDKGTPIAQIIFHFLDEPTDTPYSGKYNNQSEGPVEAILE